MREEGVAGLKKHLTASALKPIESFEKISGLPEVSLLTNSFLGDNPMNILLSKLSDMEWTIKDVMKGSETSKGVLGFSYEDKMSGTIELTMIKEDDKWKVDKLGVPKFDTITLPEFETVQADQK